MQCNLINIFEILLTRTEGQAKSATDFSALASDELVCASIPKRGIAKKNISV